MLYQDLKTTVERERLTCTKHSHLHLTQTLLKLDRSCPWNCLLPFLSTQRSSSDYMLNSPFISLIYTYESKGEFEIRSRVTYNIVPHKLCYDYLPITGKNNNNRAYWKGYYIVVGRKQIMESLTACTEFLLWENKEKINNFHLKCISNKTYFNSSSPKSAVILLPLCPVSLMHRNPQRCKIIHDMHPIGHKDRSIYWSQHVYF